MFLYFRLKWGKKEWRDREGASPENILCDPKSGSADKAVRDMLVCTEIAFRDDTVHPVGKDEGTNK